MRARREPPRQRVYDPARCEVFFRNLRGMGVRFTVDRAAGAVAATYADGDPVDMVLAVEIQARQWYLLRQPEGQEEHTADATMATF